MIKKIKWWLAKKIIKHVFISVLEEDILQCHNGKLYRGGFQLTPQDASSIITGAKSLENLEVWRTIISDTRFLLNKQIVDKAQSGDDLFFARGGLWTLEVLEKKVKNLSKLRQ